MKSARCGKAKIMRAHASWKNRLVCTVVLLVGCKLGDVKLGDDAELEASGEGSGSSEGGGQTDGQTSTTPEPSGAVGEPCNHGYAPGTAPESRLLTTPAPSCAGDVCLYADSSEPPDEPCESDVDCNVVNPQFHRFACDVPTATCKLAEDYFLESSMCSAYCESDADCATEASTTCQTGFMCVPMSSIGDACCQPVCACRDLVDEAIVNDLTIDCKAGSAGNCCMEYPGQGLCPD
jgi:hypothetical protein